MTQSRDFVGAPEGRCSANAQRGYCIRYWRPDLLCLARHVIARDNPHSYLSAIPSSQLLLPKTSPHFLCEAGLHDTTLLLTDLPKIGADGEAQGAG
jgi:hypothetical protein